MNSTMSYKLFHETQTKKATLAAFVHQIKHNTKIADICQRIRSEADKEKRNAIKKELHLMYCCAYEEGQRARAEHMISHTGDMVFDIDGITLDEAKILKNKVVESRLGKYVALVFISPSNGLKFIIRTDYRLEHEADGFYKFMYKKLQAMLIELGFEQDTVDVQTCNRNRGTYLSHDADCYYNPNCQSVSVQKFLKAFDASKQEERDRLKASRTLFEVRSQHGTYNEARAKAWVEKQFTQIAATMSKGNRHNQVFQICCVVFNGGFGQAEAAQYLYRLKGMGHYTESMSVEAKARDCYEGWDKAGGHVSEWLFDVPQEKKSECNKSMFAALVSKRKRLQL